MKTFLGKGPEYGQLGRKAREREREREDKRERESDGSRQKNKRGDSKVESNDSPEISDRR